MIFSDGIYGTTTNKISDTILIIEKSIEIEPKDISASDLWIV
jgi:hypothetical protein